MNKPDYPECSGDSLSCPENEGHGCCKPNSVQAKALTDETFLESLIKQVGAAHGYPFEQSTLLSWCTEFARALLASQPSAQPIEQNPIAWLYHHIDSSHIYGTFCFDDPTDMLSPSGNYVAKPLYANPICIAPEKANSGKRCKVGSICTPETCRCALINDEPNVCNTAQPSAQADVAAVRDVIAERKRQRKEEGWTPALDDRHKDCQLAAAAATYAVCNKPDDLKICGVTAWPWSRVWWKPTTYRRNLVKAGALIIAEIERIDRAAPTAQPQADGVKP